MKKFVRQENPARTVPLRDDDGQILVRLLWGDPVLVQERDGARSRVRARGHEGWIGSDDLGDEGLLELYIIDVGQGDGALLRTPDDKWHLIDAGISNARQMTRKGAANFLRWKFQEDLGERTVNLANVVLSHPDFDHYGGLLDVLGGNLNDGRTFEVSVGTFYHSGMGRFSAAPKLGATTNGEVAPLPVPGFRITRSDAFITELLGDATTFGNPARAFEGSFAQLAQLVATVPNEVRRISAADRFLGGYGPNDASGVVIRVLGPIAETIDGIEGLRVLSNESVTRNGHSIVLRVDYGNARILLAGDLNTESQRLLMSHHPVDEFAVDVAKGCHHGSDDVDLRFIRAMGARATVISSGDNESYAHPRPRILGASAHYGRGCVNLQGEEQPPLLYSTELARSLSLRFADSVAVDESRIDPDNVGVRLGGQDRSFRRLNRTPLVGDLVYGLVNVRTDGHTILVGTLRESGNDFELQAFQAGMDPAASPERPH